MSICCRKPDEGRNDRSPDFGAPERGGVSLATSIAGRAYRTLYAARAVDTKDDIDYNGERKDGLSRWQLDHTQPMLVNAHSGVKSVPHTPDGLRPAIPQAS